MKTFTQNTQTIRMLCNVKSTWCLVTQKLPICTGSLLLTANCWAPKNLTACLGTRNWRPMSAGHLLLQGGLQWELQEPELQSP